MLCEGLTWREMRQADDEDARQAALVQWLLDHPHEYRTRCDLCGCVSYTVPVAQQYAVGERDAQWCPTCLLLDGLRLTHVPAGWYDPASQSDRERAAELAEFWGLE